MHPIRSRAELRAFYIGILHRMAGIDDGAKKLHTPNHVRRAGEAARGMLLRSPDAIDEAATLARACSMLIAATPAGARQSHREAGAAA